MIKKILALLFVMCVLVPPVNAKKRQAEEIITSMTKLEKRQFQTKSYNDVDKTIVMKGVLNALQDEGFIVYNVNSLLGFIYGVKDFDTTDPNIDISKEFGFTKSRLNYNGVTVATMEVCVNLTDYGQDLRLRTNFKRKLLNQYGNAQFIDDVDDAQFYSEFYEKVDNAIDIQKNIDKNLQKTDKIMQKFDKIEQNLTKNDTIIEQKSDELLINLEEQTTPQNAVESTQTEEIIDKNDAVEDDTNKTEEKDIPNDQPEPSNPAPEAQNQPDPEEEISPKELKKQMKQQAKSEKKVIKQREKNEE